MDSDSDSSNIGTLLKKAHDEISVHDSDDSDSSVESVEVVEKKPAAQPQAASCVSLLDESDDDDLPAAKTVSPASLKKPAISIEIHELLSSSDEEDVTAIGSQNQAVARNKRQSKTEENKALREVKQKLEIAQRELQNVQGGVDVIERQVDETNRQDQEGLASLQACAFHICAIPSFEKGGAESSNELGSRVVFKVRNNMTIDQVIDAFVQESGLDKSSCTIGLRFLGRMLDPSKPLYKYKLVQELRKNEGANVVEVEAIVYSTGGGLVRKKAPATDYGNVMTLKLRNQAGECESFKMGEKEPFQSLVNKYRTAMKLGERQKITLFFDGAALSLKQTPASEDMEEDDLIDVRVV